MDGEGGRASSDLRIGLLVLAEAEGELLDRLGELIVVLLLVPEQERHVAGVER